MKEAIMGAVTGVIVFQLITSVYILFYVWQTYDLLDDRFEALEKKLRDKEVL